MAGHMWSESCIQIKDSENNKKTENHNSLTQHLLIFFLPSYFFLTQTCRKQFLSVLLFVTVFIFIHGITNVSCCIGTIGQTYTRMKHYKKRVRRHLSPFMNFFFLYLFEKKRSPIKNGFK